MFVTRKKEKGGKKAPFFHKKKGGPGGENRLLAGRGRGGGNFRKGGRAVPFGGEGKKKEKESISVGVGGRMRQGSRGKNVFFVREESWANGEKSPLLHNKKRREKRGPLLPAPRKEARLERDLSLRKRRSSSRKEDPALSRPLEDFFSQNEK